MADRFRTIVHPTDFSDASAEAFSHALRIALAMKGKLVLVHIGDLRYVHERDRFPSVRQALEQWRLLDEDDPPTAVGEKLGIEVETVRLEPQDPVRGLFRFLDTHPSDLIVLATHGLDGVDRWLYGSMAETLSRKIRLPTLFVPATACGFVDQTTGKLRLSRVLVPVDQSPPPGTALGIIREFIRPMREEGTAIELMHVGRKRATDGGRRHYRPSRSAEGRRRRNHPQGSERTASRPDSDADCRPPRPSRCTARKHSRARPAARTLPGPGDIDRYGHGLKVDHSQSPTMVYQLIRRPKLHHSSIETQGGLRVPSDCDRAFRSIATMF